MRLSIPRPVLAALVLVVTLGLAGPPAASAVQLALGADEFGCFNLVDTDAAQAQMLPSCAVIALVGDIFFPDVLALWPDGDGTGAVIRNFLNGEIFVASFASLAVQDLDSGLYVGAQGPPVVFAAGLGVNPEIRDGAVLPDGTVLLLVEDQTIGLFWVAELDPATGDVTPLNSVDPLVDSTFEGGLAHLGGDEVLVTLFTTNFDPAFFAVDLGGGVEELNVAGGGDVGSSTALAENPRGGFYYTENGAIHGVVVEDTAGGRRARFTDERVAGRVEWYNESIMSPQLVFLGPGGLPGGCVPDGETLCLRDGRYAVTVDWDDGARSGRGRAIQTTADSGEFTFFSASNVEMIVKVLNGCGFNGHVWVFAAATTTVEVTLRVVDTVTGDDAVYINPLGTQFATRTDTEAFPQGCTTARTPAEAPEKARVHELLERKRARSETR